MARSTPLVRDTMLAVQTAAGEQHSIAVGSPEWYCWLGDETHRNFAFASSQGTFTARKERKQHGGWYWVAYRQAQGQLSKAYLGKSDDLSLQRLHTVAALLAERAQQAVLRQPRRRTAGIPLVTTKLLLPPVRPQIVARPRLIERLQDGLTRKLTLLSAPTGFGKTTLLSNWLAALDGHGVSVAWVCLDPADNDPIRFWSYVLAALNRAAPGVGDQALNLLAAAQPLRNEAVCTALINAVAASAAELVLALDDYQVIEEPALHEALAFLLTHLPSCLHLALASRSDPPFPLARLRVLGQVVELRAADLSFTSQETATFLTQVMKLDLPPHNVAQLEARTEGWVAGLQLAALALQSHQRADNAFATFTGNTPVLQDYVLEEVLSQQPEDMRAFLVQTALLPRLSGPLCAAVTGLADSQAMLLRLEQANLFVHPLDAEQHWYRYHSLFADALCAYLQKISPHLLPLLRQRAADWYHAHGQADEAIAQLLAIPDYEAAARVVGAHAQSTLLAGQFHTLLGWLKVLPEETLRASPQLMLYDAWALLLTGQLSDALVRLQAGVESYQPMLQAQEADARRLNDEAGALARMLTAWHAGTLAARDGALSEKSLWLEGLTWVPVIGGGSIEAPQAATSTLAAPEVIDVEAATPSDALLQSLMALSLGFQAADAGDEERATHRFSEALRLSARQNNLIVSLLALCQLAELHILQGSLRRAATCYRRAQRLATDPEGHPLPMAGLAFIGMGTILREWNVLDAASRQVRTGIELCQQWGELWALDGYLALARISGAQSRWAEAQHALEEAERIAQRLENTTFLSHVAATQARIWLLQGNLRAAVQWASNAGCSRAAPISAEEESIYLLFARVFVAQGNSGQALELLARMLPTIEAAGRKGRVIEICALQAVAWQAQNATAQGLTALERALTLAAPEGYVRLFVELGEPMSALLRQACARNILPAYSNKLLTAFSTPAAQHGRVNGASLPNPLTLREREVLQLLVAGASNRAIAEALVITVGTVKKHLHNIFHKVQAESRTQAIATARTLGLL